MIMIVKTPGSQMGSPAAAEEGGEEVGGGRWESGERSEVQARSMLTSTAPKASGRERASAKCVGQQGGVSNEQRMGPRCVVAGHGLVLPVTGMVSTCTLPWLFWLLGAVDAMPIHNEESSGLAAADVDISLPLAASAAIPGAGALVAGSVIRGVTGQPAANRTHAELKNDLNKTGEIYVHTCGMCESNP